MTKNEVFISKAKAVHGDFSQTATDHIRVRASGCQVCSSSKGELKIASTLIKLGATFNKEFVIKDEPFRYDFKLINNDIIIEYDGEQHYKPIEFWGGEKQFEKTKISDWQKEILALNNGYDLIRIPYFKYDELEEYLITTLSKIYPYFYKGVFYKGFKQLLESIGKTIDTESREEYEKYHTIKLLKK